MKLLVLFSFVYSLFFNAISPGKPNPGYEERIRKYVDSIRVIDTHEHLFTPELVSKGNFSDLMLIFQQNGYDDLVSGMMPVSMFDSLYNEPIDPVEKWKLIEPYFRNAFNTSYMKVIMYGLNKFYGISDLNPQTVKHLATEIKKTYSTDKFDRILRDSCKIDYVIQDGYYMPGKDDYFRYAQRFDGWISIASHFSIDSLAISQRMQISSLEEFENSLRFAFGQYLKKGMTVIKIPVSYSRTLHFENTSRKDAEVAFRKLRKKKYGEALSFNEVKPLQDYMVYRLLELAGEHDLPVAIHTGLQAGRGNYLVNSQPLLLTNLFRDFPDVRFVLYHGSYPFGGELSALAKMFRNVYIDMNWMYSISPSYSERYLHEWLETVPVYKLMAFGGDCMAVENVYSELHIARKAIAKVLIEKVENGYFTEDEAKLVARMMLRDNAARFYKLN